MSRTQHVESTPDPAVQRAMAVSEIVSILVKLDAEDRECVLAAARAIVGFAPAKAPSSGPNLGQSLAGMTAR